MVEKILIGVIIISIIGLWLELRKCGRWSTHAIKRRMSQRRMRNKEE